MTQPKKKTSGQKKKRALRRGQIVISPVSEKRYRIGPVLGEGGFGLAYRATRLTPKGREAEEVCLKTTLDQMSWHREAYFGELLGKSKRVIQVMDSFPLAPSRPGRGPMLFCLVMELAEHGTIADYLVKTGKPWPHARAVREICAMLRLLDQLHGGSATHRDITPANIFVCNGGTLKLGDFGIARHQLPGAPAAIDAFNPAFVTRGFVKGASRYWTTVDDVYQMGQLLGMLLRGDADTIVTQKMIPSIDCPERLKQIIARATGHKRARYTDAWEMLQALENTPQPEARLKTIRDKTIAFTGPLSITRFDAEVLVLAAGGRVAHTISRNVNVVVREDTWSSNGHKPKKPRNTRLQRAEALQKAGHPLTIIGETEFRRLTRTRAR
ncbi:MAG: protein kinase [Planctomycetota bacterium]